MTKEIKKEITFIYMDTAEKQQFESIYEEAKKRGYKVKMTKNKFEKCEIGFYCQHLNFPQYSKFSVIMLHDIIQAYGRWPDIWEKEPWNKYNIGFLPGKKWEKMWIESSDKFYSHPKQGVYLVGWPKADYLRKKDINVEKIELYKKYGLDLNKKTILYAPAWENDNKQDDFVQEMKKLDVNILIKQAPVNKELFPKTYKRIEEMRELHKNIKGVYQLDPKTNIMEAIIMSDILVSEESSTMCEAVLLGIPAISVSDWLIPDVIPSRYPESTYDFVEKTTKKNLAKKVFEILNNYSEYQKKTIEYSVENFGKEENSAAIIMDILENKIYSKPLNFDREIKGKQIQRMSINEIIKFKFERLKEEIIKNYAVKYKMLGKLYYLLRKIKKGKKCYESNI